MGIYVLPRRLAPFVHQHFDGDDTMAFSKTGEQRRENTPRDYGGLRRCIIWAANPRNSAERLVVAVSNSALCRSLHGVSNHQHVSTAIRHRAIGRTRPDVGRLPFSPRPRLCPALFLWGHFSWTLPTISNTRGRRRFNHCGRPSMAIPTKLEQPNSIKPLILIGKTAQAL